MAWIRGLSTGVRVKHLRHRRTRPKQHSLDYHMTPEQLAQKKRELPQIDEQTYQAMIADYAKQQPIKRYGKTARGKQNGLI